MKKSGKKVSVRQRIGQFFREAFETDETFRENEAQANSLTAAAELLFVLLLGASYLLADAGIYQIDANRSGCLFVAEMVLMLPGLILCFRKKGTGKYLKLYLMGTIILCLAVNDMLLTYSVVLGMAVPVVISIRYYNRKLTILTAVLTVLAFGLSGYLGTRVGKLDINHVYMNSGTVLTIETSIEDALIKYGYDMPSYGKDVMITGYLPRCMVYLVIAVISEEAAYRGHQMVIERSRDAQEHGRIDAELNVARTLQERALPVIVKNPLAYDLAAFMKPAKEVAGDFYDYMMVDGSHLALMIADVSGKGVPAAMFMMVSKLLLDTGVAAGKSPAVVLEEVNRQLIEKNFEDLFVTVWLGIIDLETGTVKAANAGHEYPVLSSDGGPFEKYKDPHGLVLACMDGMTYQEYEFQMKPGDTLFLYTDGVTDSWNKDRQAFGIEGICRALDRNKSCPMEETLHKVHEEIRSFAGKMPQYDDITMVGFRLNALISSLHTVPDQVSVEKTTAFLDDKMKEKGAAEQDRSRVKIAADEIYSNVVRYSGASEAEVRIAVTDEEIGIEFRDNGVPFDPFSGTEPDVDLMASEEETVGGLGIFMTKKLMDEVGYRRVDDKNISTVRYRRRE